MENNENVSDLNETLQPEHITATGGRKKSRKRSIIIFTVVTLLNLGLLALLFTQLLTPAQTHSPNDPSLPAGSNALLGHVAPNFALTVLSGSSASQLRLADFKGKPVILNFWASSCGPCVDEAPLLQKEWQRVQAQGVAFVGVDYEDDQGSALSFIQKYAITYTNIVDADGKTAINYGVTGTPETFFIDRHGMIAAWQQGPLTDKMFQSDLQKIVR